MANTYCKLAWLLAGLRELNVKPNVLVQLFCDNQATLHIVKPYIHERIKHNELDYQYVRDKFKKGQVGPCYVGSKHQLADLFTRVVLAS